MGMPRIVTDLPVEIASHVLSFITADFDSDVCQKVDTVWRIIGGKRVRSETSLAAWFDLFEDRSVVATSEEITAGVAEVFQRSGRFVVEHEDGLRGYAFTRKGRRGMVVLV